MRLRPPVASGGYVIWLEDMYMNPDIFGYDLVTQESFVISDKDGAQRSVDIDGNIVVWMDRSSGKGDIFGARILRDSE